MKKTSFISIALFIYFSITTVAQTTYYVSVTGNDANDGLTENTAWKTINFATSSSSPVTGGDTVYIKAGDYGLDDVFINKNYDSTDERISFIGYTNTPGDITNFNFSYGDNIDASVMPLINPGDRTTGEGINLSDNYNITLKNIQITNSISGINIWNSDIISSNHILENIYLKDIGYSYSTALGITRASDNTIKQLLIVNATGAGMDIWGNNNLIENCQVYSNENEPLDGGTYSSMDYYIVIKGDYNIVKDCYAERDGDLEDVGHGLEIKESGEHNLFVDCTVKNMIAGCFSVRWSNVKNNEFRNCKALGGVSDDSVAFLVRDGASNNTFNSCTSDACKAGVRFVLSGEDEDYCGEYNKFNNCIIKDAEWAIDLNNWYYSSAAVDNNILANCVIDNATNLFNCERPNSGNSLVNCIITNTDNFLIGDDPSNFTYSHCDFYNNGFTAPTGTNNIDAYPMFIDASNWDYHLSEGSSCIDAGTSTNAPDTDFEGTTRPQGSAFDIGAFEFSGATGISDILTQENLLYPNPVTEIINIKNDLNNQAYDIISNTGQTLKKGIILNEKINLSNLPNGNYFLRIFYNLKPYSFKIIVNK